MQPENSSDSKKSVVGSVMVVGGGIAGIQASLDLADSGYLVKMVEEKSAIGGVMAQLDKTFPTNDCSMCVISPKLVEAGRHLNIDLYTMTEVEKVEGEAGNFKVTLLERPRYVDLDKCTACGECSKVCPIEMPNTFDEGLRERKAAFKLYPQGMPSAYAIEKRGTAPCKATCPAHVSIQGYIALINDGRYKEALKLFKQDHPFPAVCGRVCHHPCEGECTRNEVDQPLAIRELHRFLADYERQSGDTYIPAVEADKRDEKIAVIGAGPAGLTAAYYLTLKGYGVTIFEKLPEPGGMMRVGIPEYRLPRDILAEEIDVIRQMGVEIRCGVTFGKEVTLESLQKEGYKACFLAIGLHGGRRLGVENEDAEGVLQGVEFLRDAAMGKEVVIGEDVLVVGGGNVAIDVALTAKRKGAKNVTLICLEKREEMPAWEHEIEEALEGDIQIVNSFGPKSFFIDKNKKVSGLEFKTCTTVFDEDGRFSPQYDDNACQPFFADTVIIAIGQSTNLEGIKEQEIAISRPGGLEADPVTLQTPIEWVFAGGDAFYGPKSVVDAVACGKEAAESIHRFVNGLDLKEGREKKWEYVKPETAYEEKKKRVTVRCLDPEARECNFLEVSFGYNEEEAKLEADRCLKCGICSECYQCVEACLAKAVNHEMQPKRTVVEVGSLILAPGFSPYDPSKHEYYAYAKHPNVVTALEFERILSASGPYQGHLIRPSDHKEPEKIAWLQCIGSRDINKCDHSYCSAVCCMYAAKQTVIAKEHSSKDLDTAVFFMDMRTYGKDFERYYMRCENEKGVRFVRSRVHTIDPVEGDNLRLRYVNEEGELIEELFDMVVLSVGLAPNEAAIKLAHTVGIDLNGHQFAQTSDLAPVATNKEGIYVCGVFQGPKDIPQSVMEASAAAAASAKNLTAARGTLIRAKQLPPELDVADQAPRVGVFVCNCGINIGGVADVPAVREYARNLPHVVHVEDNLFTCSQDTQDKMKEVIKEMGINRVVVASCSPRTHEPLFQETIREAGLNKYLFEMANIRDQNTWVHMNNPAKATEKAKDLVRMAVAKAAYVEPLHQVSLEVKQTALVVGGGVAGMEAALGLADQGFQTDLVEREDHLGGNALWLRATWQGEKVRPYVEKLIERVSNHPKIRLHLNSEVVETAGILGHFTSTVATGGTTMTTTAIEHGVTVLATGGKEYQPTEYQYGQHPAILTHQQMDEAMTAEDERIAAADTAVFIQCVGSRTEERPSCSRICCTHSVKSAIALKERKPEMSVFILYRDIRTYGFREDLYRKARELGVIFIRFDLASAPNVAADGDQLSVTVKDHILGRPIELNPDLLVLATAVLPNENKDLFELFKVPINAEGFLVEAHAKLRPVDFSSEGIFMAGLAHYPKSIDETIAQAQAAVSRASTILSKETIWVGGVTAIVDPDKCAVCLTCVRTCPYHVPYIGSEGYAVIDPAGCQGCGCCVSECPGKAITLKHFTDQQLIAKTDALFAECLTQ
ncbi:FAD-dependent oxidoreductase [Desulfatitalea alkaliphila]|uniref:FAD-dependent oxidoreductase n=1 Tax=Desulfatitalea alkaliphila TaxID=2929485 RepID=A0AA41UJW6_9BACT|nr:FAD-dependent oxidoreductase [Desulfatitalea alkaliphila]MCJ8500877.1 FAD-dependent oxidoreductase [Desulfatitalea alkaliphila]